MRPAQSAVLPLFLSVALLLAGCASQDAPAPLTPTSEDAILVTAENDDESLMNESFAMAKHQHDYWGGQDRVVVLDETRRAGAFWQDDYWAEVFLPDDDVVVPQGTAFVEVTANWVDDATKNHYTDPQIWVRTAADHEALLVGAVRPGDTLTVPTTLANADLPHQSISAWRFELRIHPSALPTGTIWWAADVTLQATAVRGLDIPIYPPHPDLWGGAETIALLEASQTTGVWIDPLGACLFECNFAHAPFDGAIVPYDAAAVEVRLQQGPEAPTDLGLRYHGANTREFQEVQPTGKDGDALIYRIPIEPGMGDSPYATQSVWEFKPFVSGPVPDSVKAGSYTIKASVLRT